jgi:hypothetical protein
MGCLSGRGRGLVPPHRELSAAPGWLSPDVGRCTLRHGRVEALERISIERVGVFVRDTYEFIDDLLGQPLGWWGYGGVKMLDLPGTIETQAGCVEADNGDKPDDRYYWVSNATYNDYRTLNGFRADFVIYSDVDWVEAKERFEVPE